MTEAAFAKQFLSTLDSRPVRLPSDHVADPRQLPAQPAFILPRNAKPYTKLSNDASTSTAPTAPGASSLTITLKTVRPSPSTPTSLTITSLGPQSSIYDVKAQASRRAGFAPDKVKILWEKRPALDSKTIAEVATLAAGAMSVEMGIMFVGSPTAVPETEERSGTGKGGGLANADGAAMDAVGKEKTADTGKAGGVPASSDGPEVVALGKSGWDVCETDAFWDDLGSFVMQRVRDEEVARALLARFRESWRGSR